MRSGALNNTTTMGEIVMIRQFVQHVVVVLALAVVAATVAVSSVTAQESDNDGGENQDAGGGGVTGQHHDTSIGISGLSSTLIKGQSDIFSVLVEIEIGTQTVTVTASGTVGFNGTCTSQSYSRTISNDGSTPDHTNSFDLTLHACDTPGGSVSASVDAVSDSQSVKVTNKIPSVPSVAKQKGRLRESFSATLPAASGGDPPLTHWVSGTPRGISFTPSTRKLSGTPLSPGSSTYRYGVTDANGDSRWTSLVFEIAPNCVPYVGSVDDQSASVGDTVDITLPATLCKETPITYSVSGLPSGLSFSSSSRKITGTPDTRQTKTVTYGARDKDGDTGSTSFRFTITEDDTEPCLPDITNKRGKERKSFSTTLPTSPCGNAPISYTVTTTLPSGLNYYSSSRQIRGTPTSSGTTSVTFEATDRHGDTDTETFIITIDDNTIPDLPDTITVPDVVVRTEIDITLPAATGGEGTLAYQATNRPKGVSFNSNTLKLYGIPTTVETKTIHYSVSDEDGDSDSTSFVLRVVPQPVTDIPPVLGSVGTKNGNLFVMFSTTLPAATGGNGTINYFVDGRPSWLVFDESSRELSGTPTTPGTFGLTYKATDSDSNTSAADTASVSFNLVVPDLTPMCPAIGSQSGTVNVRGRWDLPAATGGDGALTYVLSNLPDGLSYSGRVVTGTPSTKQTRTVRYTATDRDVERSDSCTKTFSFEIGDDGGGRVNSTPDLPDTVESVQTTIGVDVSATLPAATGGDGTLMYSLSGLPLGLRFDGATRRILGTPTGSAQTSEVTYAVRDADGETDSVTFDVAVELELDKPGDERFLLVQYRSVDLPLARGGKGSYTYELEGRLPGGLLFDSSSTGPRIYGTGTEEVERTVKYSVTDEADTKKERSFKVAGVQPARGTLRAGSTTVKVGETFRVTASVSPSSLSARLRYTSGLVVGGFGGPARGE